MTPVAVFGRVLATALLLLGLIVVYPPSAFAQASRDAAPDATTPLEEFSRQIEQLKKTFGDLGKKIDESSKTIDGMTDVDKARREIEELRAIVGNLLGAVSDNGTVAQLGAKAMAHARDKVKALERETRFSKEDQQFLLTEWRKLVEETERAGNDLGTARKEFVQLLRTLQTREDFIDELMQIRRAAEALRVIRQLANEIRNASDSLKNLIRAIKPPGGVTMRVRAWHAAVGLAVLGLAGCLPEDGAGYVEVKVFPRFTLPLYLNTDKIESMKDGVAVLRQAVGKSKLQLERNGQLFSLCEFDVRKNRITTVTVSTLDRGPRCEVQR